MRKVIFRGGQIRLAYVCAIFAAAVLGASFRADASDTCDASAGVVYVPAQGTHGLIAFEDLWPHNGDLDFNDQTVAFNYEFLLDSTGKVVTMKASFNVLAAGASLHNGLYLHLPLSRASNPATIIDQDGGAVHALQTESDLVVPIVADTRSLFSQQYAFMNTQPTLAVEAARPLNLTFTFDQGAALVHSLAPFDLFIARSNDFRFQIHLPQFKGTDAMDTSLFGQGDDRSSPTGLHFINQHGLPFALAVPEVIQWPQERVAIDSVYRELSAFASSGGVKYPQWYSEDINTSLAFTHGAGNQPPPQPQLVGPSLTCATTPPAEGPPASVHLTAVKNGVHDASPALELPAGAVSGLYADTFYAHVEDRAGQPAIANATDPTENQLYVQVACNTDPGNQCRYHPVAIDPSTGNPFASWHLIPGDANIGLASLTFTGNDIAFQLRVDSDGSPGSTQYGNFIVQVGFANPGHNSSAVYPAFLEDEAAPQALTYSTNTLSCTVGQSCALQAPSNAGGRATGYTISPSLPSGLVFNASTGAISGSPLAAASTATYAVTASNSGGSSTASFSITVAPPDLCIGVVCAAIDQCHSAGSCAPSTGLCSTPPAADGVTCSLGDGTPGETCRAGVCVPPAPTITDFTPASALTTGRSVLINGTNFTGATRVTFNGVSQSAFTVTSATQIRTAVPSGATSGLIQVTTPGGTATSPAPFYLRPKITAFTPGRGAPGTAVAISGINLTGATGVTFGGAAAQSFSVDSGTHITAIVGQTGSGSIAVTTQGGTASTEGLLLASPTRIGTAGHYPTSIVLGDVNNDGIADLVITNHQSNNVSVSLGKADGTYQAAQTFASGNGPISVVIGDFDGDGNPDLAVALYYDGAMAVLRGNGDGTFQAPAAYLSGANPVEIAVGDLNNDGRLDLVVANYSSNDVSVFIGVGDGTFLEESVSPHVVSPSALAIGDLNHDGRSDLVVANDQNGEVAALLGNGDGTFQPQLPVAVGSSPDSVVLGDMNGDGQLDLVVGEHESTAVLIGNGNGTFQAAVVQPGVGRIALADVNGDGSLDVVGTNWTNGSVGVLLGAGGGILKAPVNYASGGRPYSVAIGDLNGDGELDLVVVNALDDNALVILGNGDGTFQAAAAYQAGVQPTSVAAGDLNGDGVPDLVVADNGPDHVLVLIGDGHGSYLPGVPYATGLGPFSVTLSDVNGDGRLDIIAVHHHDSGVSVLLGNGDGTFQSALTFPTDSNPTSLAIGDVNEDGIPDLVVANSTANNLTVFLGAGNGTFSATQTIADPWAAWAVVLGDVDGNGHLDIIVASQDSNIVQVFYGHGNGTFDGGAAAVNFPVGTQPRSLLFADLNGDGKKDLAVANYGSNDVSVLLGTGNSLHPFEAALTFAAGAAATAIACGDIDGDGIPDLVLANSGASNLTLLLGIGDGSFRAPLDYATSGPAWPAGPGSLVLADLDRDGRLDIAVVDANHNVVEVVHGTGNRNASGRFEPAVNYAVGDGPHAVVSGDLNGDGIPDVAVANTNSNSVSVLFGSGAGSFQPALPIPTGRLPSSVAIGQTRRNGHSDLVVANAQDNNVSVILGNGDGTFQPAVNYLVGNFPWSVALGDVNGDGKLDIIVANEGGNTVSILIGNGDGTFQTQTSVSVPGQPYSVALGELDRNGHLDIVTVCIDGGVAVLRGNGDGTFQAAAAYAAGTSPTSVAIADVNGDGRLDVVALNDGSSSVSVLLGNGDGTLQAAVNLPVGNNPVALVVADVNGDGKPDLLIADAGTTSLAVLFGNGDGTFQPLTNYAPAAYGPFALAVADLNRDGTPDVIVANVNSSDVSVFLGAPQVFFTELYGVSGTIDGLTSSGLVLGSPGEPNLVVPSGATGFAFANNLPRGEKYSVKVVSEPANFLCTVANGSGAVGPGQPTVAVTCRTAIFGATGSMSTPRGEFPTATLLPNGLVLVAGGRGPQDASGNECLASANLYDPTRGTFAPTGSLGTKRAYHTATLLPNGLVLIAGGSDGSTGVRATAELYDPSRGTFTATGSMSAPRFVHSATLLPNGLVLIAGGYNDSVRTVATAELYDPSRGTFNATGSLNTKRFYHTATLLPNGLVLMAGGVGASGSPSSAELYDPSQGSFSPTGGLNTARYLHTATLLPNGLVLVAGGGSNDNSFLSSAELYDPSQGTFSSTGGLGTARLTHSATLLPDGNVLIAGGTHYPSYLASAELYY